MGTDPGQDKPDYSELGHRINTMARPGSKWARLRPIHLGHLGLR